MPERSHFLTQDTFNEAVLTGGMLSMNEEWPIKTICADKEGRCQLEGEVST
jgi:hypothetical protein